jgi:hypothetical protein
MAQMRVEVIGDSLKVTWSETNPSRQSAERPSFDYAVMRSSVVGGGGTTIRRERGHTIVTPANRNVQEVKAAIEVDYAQAMKENALRDKPRKGRPKPNKRRPMAKGGGR